MKREQMQPASPREEALGAVRKVRQDLHLSVCGVTRFEWGQTSVELYEPQSCKGP